MVLLITGLQTLLVCINYSRRVRPDVSSLHAMPLSDPSDMRTQALASSLQGSSQTISSWWRHTTPGKMPSFRCAYLSA